MFFKEATIQDIDSYMIVRMAVKENVLNNQALIPREANVDYLTKYGKGWLVISIKKVGTEKNTKAELFYKNRGWTRVGMHGEDETKFEMT